MKKFISYKYGEIYPLIGIFVGLIVVVFSLIYAKNIECSYFLIGAFSFFLFFIDIRKCLKALALFVILGGIFFLIIYFVTDSYMQGIYMVNRIGAFIIGMLPSVSLGPDRLANNLSELKAPRSLTIGMLIAFSFLPILKEEIKRVKEAMKTRGSYSIINPKIFYRAFLIPFVTRIVDISDTLSLSIETRGFDLKSKDYTTYKGEIFRISDVILAFGIIALLVLVIVL